MYFLLILSTSITSLAVQAESAHGSPQSIPTAQIQDFDKNPLVVKNMLTLALNLANQNLTYKYGSADPNQHGMDCSGTLYYLLTKMGVKSVPRQSNTLFLH